MLNSFAHCLCSHRGDSVHVITQPCNLFGTQSLSEFDGRRSLRGGRGNGPDRIATESRPSSSVGRLAESGKGPFQTRNMGFFLPWRRRGKYIFRTFFVPAAMPPPPPRRRSLNKSRKVEDVARRKLGDHKAEGGTKGERSARITTPSPSKIQIRTTSSLKLFCFKSKTNFETANATSVS